MTDSHNKNRISTEKAFFTQNNYPLILLISLSYHNHCNDVVSLKHSSNIVSHISFNPDSIHHTTIPNMRN